MDLNEINHAMAATADPPRRGPDPRTILTVAGCVMLAMTLLVLAIGVFSAADKTLTQDQTPAEAPAVTVVPVTAQGVLGDLRAHDFTLTDVAKADTLYPDSYDARIDGVEASVLAFADEDIARGWHEALVQFGGIAVVGRRWAVSLDSDASGGTPYRRSQELAYQIANEIGGDVVDTLD